MRVGQFMTKGMECVAPDCSVQEAAGRMKRHNVGLLAVCGKEGLKGVVTDRDIVVRLVAHGGDAAKTAVGEIMTRNPVCCYEDAPIRVVARLMEARRVRRIPVLDRGGGTRGLLSLDDFVKRRPGKDIVAEVLEAAAARHR